MTVAGLITPKLYRRRVEVVRAVQITADNGQALADATEGAEAHLWPTYEGQGGGTYGGWISLFRGLQDPKQFGRVGDWLIRYESGALAILADDEFTALYVEPKVEADA